MGCSGIRGAASNEVALVPARKTIPDSATGLAITELMVKIVPLPQLNFIVAQAHAWALSLRMAATIENARVENNLQELLAVAKEAAQMAAYVHAVGAQGRLKIHTKSSPADLVTQVDREAERQLVIVILRARPDDSILGEEGTDIVGTTGVRWILDPLDGTTNYIYGYPAHAVSVGVEIDGKRVLGVVHDTHLIRVYAGVVGDHAGCDGLTIQVNPASELSRALVGTGFLPNAMVRNMQAETLKRVLPRIRDIRRSGCPSLDLCAVASGALDAYYEFGLGRWDIVGGAAIAEAAGAKVIELHLPLMPNPLLVVANPALADALLVLIDMNDVG